MENTEIIEQEIARRKLPEPGLETTLAPAKSLNDIDTEDMKYPNCPWCGFEHYENYTDFSVESIYDCENCGKDFEVKHVYHYTTERYSEET